MKCPKCGFNSFESNDTCPKCAVSLKELKQTYGLAPVVFSPEYRQILAAEYGAGQSATHAGGGEGGEFAFESAAGQHDRQSDEPAASFDDAATERAGGSLSPVRDPFAELLETSPQPVKAEPQQPAPSFPDQGYELSSFSWDDTPESAAPAEPATETAQPAAPAKEEEDFASLFGDLGDTKK